MEEGLDKESFRIINGKLEFVMGQLVTQRFSSSIILGEFMSCKPFTTNNSFIRSKIFNVV